MSTKKKAALPTSAPITDETRSTSRDAAANDPILVAEIVGAVYNLRLDDLRPSARNPRLTIDTAEIETLTKSIRQNGVLVPLRVREETIDDATPVYTIAAGHRRALAAAAAGLGVVPCLVSEMTDAEFELYLQIENAQHVALHPLDEALGWLAWLQRAEATLDDLVRISGFPRRRVYDRLRLARLIDALRDDYRCGAISDEHAIILSRLDADAQTQVRAEGLYIRDHATVTRLLEESENARLVAVSTRALREWVNKHVRLSLDDEEMPELFPTTNVAIKAANTDGVTILPITFEYSVAPDARDVNGERTYGPTSWRRAEKMCAHEVVGVVVVGPDRGTSFMVCIERKKCRVHWGSEIASAAKREKAALVNAATKGEAITERFARENKERAERETQRRVESARWKKAAPALLSTLANALGSDDASVAKFVATIAARLETRQTVTYEATRALLTLGPKPKPVDAIRALALVALSSAILDEYTAPTSAPKMLAAFKIDAKKIVNLAAPIAKPEAATKAPAKKK
jgi:ParB/RepB/Spo0J family partition protein